MRARDRLAHAHPPPVSRVRTPNRPHQAQEGGEKKLAVCIVMELCEMGDLTAYLKVAPLNPKP